ncbi:MAG: arylesterase [Pseudomonadota bacterium]|nr:arylesterase [Pseudomonadota bacterium]
MTLLALAHTLPVPAQAAAPVILIVGDSISAGYGLAPDRGWARLLRDRLRDQGYRFDVVNASISGDTTAGGRSRLPALLREHHPAVVVIELGGNDGLRGGDVKVMRDNLDAMVGMARKAGARVLLVGMRMPPNYGPAYTQQFAAAYADVAHKNAATLVPFFFEGFAETGEWFQPDRIHPTVSAQPRLLENLWPALKGLLEKRA